MSNNFHMRMAAVYLYDCSLYLYLLNFAAEIDLAIDANNSPLDVQVEKLIKSPYSFLCRRCTVVSIQCRRKGH